jgi:hypothetical protein
MACGQLNDWHPKNPAPSPFDKGGRLRSNQGDFGELIMQTIKPGIYQHYKGNLYQVVETCRHSETLETLVVYRALYGERGLWVRPYAMFIENVLVEGKSVPRFQWMRDVEDVNLR